MTLDTQLSAIDTSGDGLVVVYLTNGTRTSAAPTCSTARDAPEALTGSAYYGADVLPGGPPSSIESRTLCQQEIRAFWG